MPAASFADLYAQTWDLWQQGKHQQAMDMHAKTLLLLTEMEAHGVMESMKYILCERGVFKTHVVRRRPRQAFDAAAKIAAGGNLAPAQLDDAGKQSLREALEFLKPYLRV
jgi:dihydrodipicolinate synthase/N-acetylneuraminate lyase